MNCEGTGYLLSAFTSNENVLSNHPIPEHTSPNSFVAVCYFSAFFLSLSLLGPRRKYLIPLLFNKEVSSGLLLKFELLRLFAFISVPGIEHFISL